MALSSTVPLLRRGFAGLEESQLYPDRVPPPIVPPGVPQLPDELDQPEPEDDLGGDWDPTGIALLARLFARSYLRAQAEGELSPDE